MLLATGSAFRIFSFILIRKSIMALLTDQLWRVLKEPLRVLKFWYTGGGPRTRNSALFRRRLNQSFVSSDAQATI